MRTLVYEKGMTATERGVLHGRSFAEEIKELARIRTELIQANWEQSDDSLVMARAAEHLKPLEDYDRELYLETLGIAEGSGCSPEEIIVLNHYTDLRNLKLHPDAPDEGCSTVWAGNSKGVALAQSWDMHGTAAPFVMMLRVPEPVDMWCLTITGCLALCGLSKDGVGVCINNLLSLDARVGVIWPALVRKMLEQPSARDAWSHLLSADVGSGHHYVLADAQEIFAVETSGKLRKTIFQGEENLYYHTNHCLDDETAAKHWVSKTSTTWDRYRVMGELLEESDEPDYQDLWAVLGSKKEYPRALFTNMASDEKPHGMFTCARISMDLKGKQLLALPGLDGVGEGELFGF